MKISAVIPDELITDVQEFTEGKNITESIIKALSDWLYLKRIQRLNDALKKNPLQFADGFSAESVRNLSERT